MLSKLVIQLEKTEEMNQNMGSVLQGVLMEMIDPAYAEVLHQVKINPYSQNLYMQKDYAEWSICTLTDEAREKMIMPLLMDTKSSIRLKQKNMEIKIIGKVLSDTSLEEVMEHTYFEKCSPFLQLRFHSPTAFKVHGHYQNYPTIEHIFKSLIRKYDAFSGQEEIFSEELIQQIQEHAQVTQYNLRSTFFYLEGVRVPAFRGTITIKLKGPQMFINLMHLLAAFGEYSGVGIKTSIGMGKTEVAKREERA